MVSKRPFKAGLFLIIGLGLWFQNCYAQTLKEYRWNNRLLVISDPEKNTNLEAQQLQLLAKNPAALEERDLLIVKIENDSIYKVLNRDQNLILDPSGIKSLKRDHAAFSILLIGLDGGIKLRQNTPITREDLFALIDGMPMRRAEIRSKNK